MVDYRTGQIVFAGCPALRQSSAVYPSDQIPLEIIIKMAVPFLHLSDSPGIPSQYIGQIPDFYAKSVQLQECTPLFENVPNVCYP